jgi:hypothetical protein
MRMFWMEVLAHLCVFMKATLLAGRQSRYPVKGPL